MEFALDSEQQQFNDSASRYFRERGELSDWLRLAESDVPFDRAAWEQMAEFGWLALNVSEEDGGVGASPVYTAVMMEHAGRALSREPLVSSGVIAAQLIAAAHPAVKAELVASLIEGKAIFSLAHAELTARFNLSHVTTRAEAAGSGFSLTGLKSYVPDGSAADWLIVPARTNGAAGDAQGISLFLVPADAAGLTRENLRGADYRHSSRLSLQAVQVGPDAVIGTLDAGLPLLEKAVDHGIAAGLAEAVGIMESLRDITLEYLKTRKQFGVNIGSFQALQHRMVDMEIACEEARAIMRHAVARLDADTAERRRAISAAKTRVGQTSLFVAHQAVQLHGGIGTTDELIVSHYLKRIVMLEISYGNADYHRTQFLAADRALAAA